MATSSPLPPIRQKEIEAFLQANPLVRHWLTKWKPITRKLYAIDIIKFQQLSNTQIEQLLLRLENNQIKPREIRSLIETSLADLPNSVQARMDSAVRGFFKHHHGKLPDTTIKYQKIRDYRAYHKDELQALIGFLDKPLEQLFAIIATETGLRGGTVLQLKWRHIEQDFNNRAGPIAIRLENSFHTGRKKSGFTFIGDRARQLIRRSTETSKSERGYRIYTESDRNIFPYSYDSILTIIKTAKDKAQLDDPALSPIHSFRKFFREQLTNAQIHPDHIKVLFGRFDDTDAKEYTSKEFETLRPEYEHAYPYLDYMNNAPEQARKLSTKQTELQDLIKQQNERIQALQDQVGPINQALSTLGEVFGQALPRKFQNNTSNQVWQAVWPETTTQLRTSSHQGSKRHA
jgi:integrase